MSKPSKNLRTAAAILKQNKRDTKPYAKRTPPEGNSPRKAKALAALINKAPAGLKPFVPKPWVCETFSQLIGEKNLSKLTGRANRPKLLETFYFTSLKEAKALAKAKTQKFDAVNYTGIIRPADAKDLCAQRLEDIQTALLKFLEQALKSEENILVYDTFLFGKPNLKGFAEPLQESIELTFEEPETPQSMGWVGADGRP